MNQGESGNGRKTRRRWSLAVAAFGMATTVPWTTVAAQDETPARRTLEAARLSGAIVLDGRLDEPAWGTARVATDFVQQRPQPGEPASERTTVRVLYDDRALYVGMRMYDSSPDSIVAQLGRRDANGLYADWAHVVIDSYRDRRTAFRFAATPRGVQRDVLHFDDRSEDVSWNAVWEVATSIDAEGWTAEFRIPLSQLRFSTDGERALVWGINFFRDVARREERSYWNPVPPEASGFVSLFGELRGLEAVPAPRRLEVAPYAATRVSRRPPTHHRDPFWRRTEPGADVGVDLSYGLGPQLTLSATINPDFGQVEVDPAVVNLSAFPTFFPERRPFFLEGADIFRFGINIGGGGQQTLFYTRRIGRPPQRGLNGYHAGFVDSPSTTRILGAAKLSGQTGPWSIGVLNALTRAETATIADTVTGELMERTVEPMASYGVARVIRSFRGGESRLGGMVTLAHRSTREDELRALPGESYALGVDGRHRFRNATYELSGWLTASHVRGDTLALQRLQSAPGRYFERPDAAHLVYDPHLTSMSGWASNLRLAKVAGNWQGGWIGDVRSAGFEVNDLGFHQAGDRLLTGIYLNRLQFQPVGLLRSFRVHTDPLFAGWSFGGERVYTGSSAFAEVELLNHWRVWGGSEFQLPALSSGALRGGPAIRTQPTTGYWGGVSSDRRRSFYVWFGYDGGFEHGTEGFRYAVYPQLTYRPAPHLQLSAQPRYARSRDAWQYLTENTFARLDQTTVSMETRLDLTFSPTMTLELFAQPFVSAGEFSDVREVVAPRAPRFADRFAPKPDEEHPPFNLRSLRGNAVFRWEYRPGSALFLVWQQQREDREPFGAFRFSRDVPALVDTPAHNVLLLKVTYWFGG